MQKRSWAGPQCRESEEVGWGERERDEGREGKCVGAADEAEAAGDGERERVGWGERAVEAGEWGGGGEREREEWVEGRDACVEGDEGGERG